MKITETRMYVNEPLVEKGYATVSAGLLNFSRYYSDEEMEQNGRAAKAHPETYRERCEHHERRAAEQLQAVLSAVKDRYRIHQLTPETSTSAHYNSDWDLFFWSNRGWNGHDYFDHFTLTFNDKRSPEANMSLLHELIPIFESVDVSNVSCRVQYHSIENAKKIREDGERLCREMAGKTINYRGYDGKIKPVGNGEYGFFRKGARSRYYPVSFTSLVLSA